MFYIKNKYYSISFIVISFFILVSLYPPIFKQIDDYNSSRIYNLTKVPNIYRVSLIHKFIDKQYVKNSILVLGDSQPNGFRYPEKDIFSTILAKKLNKKVINAAFRDARISDSLYILEYLKNKNFKFETIIFNVNPAHPKEAIRCQLDVNKSIDYKLGIVNDSKYFRDFTNNFNPTIAPKTSFYEYPIFQNFFDMPNKSLDQYLLRLKKLINLAKSISDQVIIYATPHCSDDFKRLKLNSFTIDKLEKKVLNICKENNVTFLKPPIKEKSYFSDIVHFNAKGHRKMAEIIYNVIQK
jgi:hypothetical protein